jgi:hypothetical protein
MLMNLRQLAVLAVTGLLPLLSMGSVAGAATLPDDRAYEMVSPVQKNSANIALPGTLFFSAVPRQSSPSGDKVTFPAWSAFGEAVESAPAASQYIGERRPSGWSTRNINPEFQEGYFRDPLVGFSADLDYGAVIALAPQLTPDAQAGISNLYKRDLESGALTAMTTEPPAPTLVVPPSSYCVTFGGASEDFEHVFFAAKGSLLPGNPVAAGYNLYEWSGSSGLRLVSVLPNGAAAVPAIKTNFGNGNLSAGASFCDPEEDLRHHAVSVDGSRAFWTYDGSFEGAVRPLFAWTGQKTIRLDKPNQGVAGVGGGGEYWDAASDGSKVLFSSKMKLTEDSGANPAVANGRDLYLYDFDAPSGQRVTDLTPKSGSPALIRGVVGASDDLDYVYFIADAVLTPPLAENEHGEHAEEDAGNPVPNLYVWHEGEGIRFIGILDPGESAVEPGDRGDWMQGSGGPDPSDGTARVTPTGAHLAFVSRRSLTGYDNTVRLAPTCQRNEEVGNYIGGPRCPEAFLYSYELDSLLCASCNPAGERPLGGTSVPGWSLPFQQPRFISDDGARLFFQTRDQLRAADESDKQDIYEWEAPGAGSCTVSDIAYSSANGGCIYLISSGIGHDHTHFVDASADGGDIFLSTRDPLLAIDRDERFDLYDARIGGGFPEPSVEAPCETAVACHPGTSSAPARGAPGIAPLSAAASSGSKCDLVRKKAKHLRVQAKKARSKARRLGRRDDPKAKRLREKASRLARKAGKLTTKARACAQAGRNG